MDTENPARISHKVQQPGWFLKLPGVMQMALVTGGVVVAVSIVGTLLSLTVSLLSPEPCAGRSARTNC